MPLRLFVVLIVAGLITGCSGSGRVAESPTLAPTPVSLAPPPGAQALPGGCGATVIYRGHQPAWLRNATEGLTGMNTIPYAIADPAEAAGFLFDYPLRAESQSESGDGPKILWVVRTLRQGRPLEISARTSGSRSAAVHETAPANSGPGEIYPDGVKIPTAGCWEITLRWATGKARVGLLYS